MHHLHLSMYPFYSEPVYPKFLPEDDVLPVEVAAILLGGRQGMMRIHLTMMVIEDAEEEEALAPAALQTVAY
ncbi:hypothetical protein Tco_0266851 [Tanacetum coccineum]